jgi:hypothetical protein
MSQPREETKRFRFAVLALLVRTASVGVASGAILAAQTLLGTRDLSGAATDTPTAIATDPQANVDIAGATTSPDFPLTQALFQQLPEPALRVSADGRTFVPATLSTPEVNTVVASGDGRVILVGTDTGLYRSSDGGATWALSTSHNSHHHRERPHRAAGVPGRRRRPGRWRYAGEPLRARPRRERGQRQCLHRLDVLPHPDPPASVSYQTRHLDT